MTGRRRRGLSPEEQALWNKIAEQTVPLHPRRETSDIPEKIARPAKSAPEPKAPIDPFEIGQKRTETALPHDFAPRPGEWLNGQAVSMDHKAHNRMKRGKLRPEAKIDLHGMTLAQAHPALIRFISDQYARDRRLVLVITGKGRGGDDDGSLLRRRGILKQQVPHWLQSAPLGAMVLQVSEAHLKHGGEGAYYVYLRRRR